MQKTFSILVYMGVLFLFTSCSKSETKTVTDSTEPVSSIYSESEETTADDKEEETTEWVNPYAENYRVIVRQHINDTIDWVGDWRSDFLGDAIGWIRSSKKDENEACIAIVSLTKIGEDNGEFLGDTPIYLKIEKVLEHNGNGELLTEGASVVSYDRTEWILRDDNTYEIIIEPTFLPLVEVGSQYVVYMEYYNGRLVKYNLTRPFRSDGCYVDTVAIGADWHEFMSAETMWYYDINSEYYMEFLEKNPEYLKECIDNGIDLYDKNSAL